jgi:hypothetical protein
MWIDEIKRAKRARDEWYSRGEKIVERYRDERDISNSSRRFNILWSNIQTLKPSLYSNTPKAVVTRRYKDPDPIGRETAEIIERAADYSLDEYDFDAVMSNAVEDRLLPGLGVARVDYVPSYLDGEVAYEQAICKYIHWKDFLHGPGRVWEEVEWVAYRSFLTREELVERFGEPGWEISLDHRPEEHEEPNKAEIWEIWDKNSKTVIWTSIDKVLEEKEPHLNLKDYFPSPKPLFATTTTDSLIPVPDYVEYQDHAIELDLITQRISLLTKAMRVAGVYDASADGLDRLLSEGVDNGLIPVESWAAVAQKGGLDGAISWLPIDQVIKVLMGLYEAREQVKQTLYEVTGLSDIIRGASDPNETLGAQRLKGQYVNRRLKQHQKEVARFARDLIQLKVEIMAELFSPQTLQLMTGRQVTEDIINLLRNDPVRTFRLDIETDSTLLPDEQADKEARIEFLTAVSSFMERAAIASEQRPEMAPLFGEMLMFGVRGFNTGRELEGVVEDAVEQSKQPKGDDPVMMLEQQRSQIEQQKIQFEAQKLQLEQQRAQIELSIKERESELKSKELEVKFRETQVQELELQYKNAEVQTRFAESQNEKEIQAGRSMVEQNRLKIESDIKERELCLKEKELCARDAEASSKLINVEEERRFNDDMQRLLQESIQTSQLAIESANQANEGINALTESLQMIQSDRERMQSMILGYIEQNGSSKLRDMAREMING